MGDTFVMNFSPDGRTLLAGSNSQFLAIELYLDYPNSRIFSETLENQISHFSLPSGCQNLQISNDGKYLFIVRKSKRRVSANDDSPDSQEDDDPSEYRVFEIWDVSNSSAPKAISSYESSQDISEVHFAPSYETAYMRGDNFITVLDIANKSSITEKKSLQCPKRDSETFPADHFIRWKDRFSSHEQGKEGTCDFSELFTINFFWSRRLCNSR